MKRTFYILNVGTVTERKGQQDLIDAMSAVDDATRKRIVLALVGLNPSEYSQRVSERLNYLQRDSRPSRHCT